MANAVTFDVTYTEQRNRVTTLFRYFLSIPHFIVAAVWGFAAQILAFLQWFVILFTGRRNEGMWRFQRGFLGYGARINAYSQLLFDEYPSFGTSWGSEPVAFGFDFEADANRLTNALRFVWAIPAAIIGLFLGIGAFFVVIVSWFAILFTGRHPRGMFDFVLRVLRFNNNYNAYVMLMTDGYPKYDSSEPSGVLSPGDQTGSDGTYAPTPGAPLPPPASPPIA